VGLAILPVARVPQPRLDFLDLQKKQKPSISALGEIYEIQNERAICECFRIHHQPLTGRSPEYDIPTPGEIGWSNRLQPRGGRRRLGHADCEL
jgi:hypothetical protein